MPYCAGAALIKESAFELNSEWAKASTLKLRADNITDAYPHQHRRICARAFEPPHVVEGAQEVPIRTGHLTGLAVGGIRLR
jgi:hypothetical protein